MGNLIVLGLALALPLVPPRARPAAAPPPVGTTDKAVPATPAPRQFRQPHRRPPGCPTSRPPIRTTPRLMQGGGGQGWAVAVSPDGKTLAADAGGTGNNEGALTLYDLPEGKERVTLTEPRPIRCVAFSRDGKHLATGDFSNFAQLRDPKTGAVRQVLRGHTGAINSLDFTPDSKRLVTASLDKTLKVWDVADGKNTHTLTDHTDWVLMVRVGRDGKTS